MYLLYIIPLSIVAGLIYLYFRFICTLSTKTHLRFLFFSGLIGIIGLMMVTLALKRRGIAGIFTDALSWVSYTGIGFLSFLITFLLLRDVFLFWWKISSKLIHSKKCQERAGKEPELGRRMFLSGAFTSFIAGSAVSCTGVGVFLAKKTPEIKNVVLPVKNLPKSLESFSIVQISDIHLSSTCKRDFLEDVVARVNRMNPDLIALTGDLADGVVGVLGEEATPLGQLAAKYGKFFVTGNHEYYFNAEDWIEKVETLGFKALIDSHELIAHNGGTVLIAGVADYRARHFIKSHISSPLKAIHNAPPADVKILLAHQPKNVFEAAAAGFDIQLSGHTHGGQFFPWQFAIGIDQPYLAGLYRHEQLLLYVSRGTGYWGPPVRMGAPSEITLLQLTSV